jgi:TonB family protein
MKKLTFLFLILFLALQSSFILAQDIVIPTTITEPITLDSIDKIDITKTCTMPAYVDELRRYGLTGNVILKAIIDEEGKLASFELIRSSGWKALDFLTMRALVNCQILPKGKYTPPLHKMILFKWIINGLKQPSLDESSCMQSDLVRIAKSEDKDRGIVVGAVISEVGKTEKSSIQWSSDDPALDQESLKLVNSCSYKRAWENGVTTSNVTSVRLVKK